MKHLVLGLLCLLLSLTSKAKVLNIVASGFNSCHLFRQVNPPVIVGEDGTMAPDRDRYYFEYGPTPVKSNMHKKFMQDVYQEGDLYFISCFTGLIGVERLYYVNSDDPLHAKTIEVEDYAQEILMFIQQHHKEIDRVKIIGHSHGGWLSLELVTQLSKSIPVEKLITIDPISFNECDKKTILRRTWWRLKKLLSWPFIYAELTRMCVQELKHDPDYHFTYIKAVKECRESLSREGVELNLLAYLKKLYDDPTDGCLSAPWAIDDSLIRESVSYWANFYQQKSFFLHSSIYEQADDNIELDAGHVAVDTDRKAWEKFY